MQRSPSRPPSQFPTALASPLPPFLTYTYLIIRSKIFQNSLESYASRQQFRAIKILIVKGQEVQPSLSLLNPMMKTEMAMNFG